MQRPVKFGRIEYEVEEHQVLQSTLRRDLAPEMVSQRHGPGGQKLAYIEGWRLIALANEVFGFNGWSHAVVQQTIDCVDQIEDKFYVGVSSTVRVELKDGAFHEDIGYGVCEGMKSKALSLEKARKEAATDGLKRALKGFGNVLGNCLNNKNYLRWANKFPVATPAQPQKNETILEVPPDVHKSRYNAMEGKKRTAEAVKVPQLPTSLPREEKKTAEPPESSKQKQTSPHCPMLTTVKPLYVSGGQKSENNSLVKDDLLNESDPVKLERKRRQQQKKEEFLQQQMKRHKSDDNKPVGPINIKAEQSSPIPEDDTETWMREIDPESFALVNEIDWGDDDDMLANGLNEKRAANPVPSKPSTMNNGPKSNNFRK
ncbi:hypothetical protein GHT06_021815 [Daphnia sinensis]|uniref:DNA repair protein RAD52 homolog n=1 Tax=Daphnia sinensis TaxID=1820382 RepID=A0AAD5KHL4_9CRUS|nr:hypothetical protein GHT06_021815 [Daphnia sinensis]